MATKKEKLFKKITDLLELKRTEFPDNCSGISFPTNDTFERWSISRLDCCYMALLKTYNMLVQQKEVEKYFSTPEGIVEKRELEASCGQLYKKFDEINYENTQKISKLIVDFLGDDFICQVFARELRIGLKDVANENAIKFGHDFSFYVHQNFIDENFKVFMNYGTLGSFDPLDENCERGKYLMAMGKFAENTQLIYQLKDIMIDWQKQNTEINKKINLIENKLKNPLK